MVAIQIGFYDLDRIVCWDLSWVRGSAVRLVETAIRPGWGAAAAALQLLPGPVAETISVSASCSAALIFNGIGAVCKVT